MENPLLSYEILMRLNDVNNGSHDFKVAPVAEYKGVALCERPGKVKKVYKGTEYTTDGKSYIFQRHHKPEILKVCCFDDERTSKLFIDSTPDLTPYFSYKEVCELIGLEPRSGQWEWNEEQGMFLPVE